MEYGINFNKYDVRIEEKHFIGDDTLSNCNILNPEFLVDHCFRDGEDFRCFDIQEFQE